MKTFLLVEDDRILSKLVKAILETTLGNSVKILCAYTVKEALEIAKLTHIDIFMFDVLLPDGNGIEIARELRKTTHPFTPMMIASSIDDLKTQVNVNNELDVFLYITKPYDPTELIPKFESILKRLNKPIGDYVALKKGSKRYKIDLNDVILVDKIANEKQIEIYILDPDTGKVRIQGFPMQSLEAFQKLLSDARDLVRVNQSTFVNPKFVDYYDGLDNEVHLKHTNRIVSIGKTYKDSVKLLFRQDVMFDD